MIKGLSMWWSFNNGFQSRLPWSLSRVPLLWLTRTDLVRWSGDSRITIRKQAKLRKNPGNLERYRGLFDSPGSSLGEELHLVVREDGVEHFHGKEEVDLASLQLFLCTYPWNSLPDFEVRRFAEEVAWIFEHDLCCFHCLPCVDEKSSVTGYYLYCAIGG